MAGGGGAEGEVWPRPGPESGPQPAGRAAAVFPFQWLSRACDLSSDGGVRKEELRPGSGQAVPPGASLAVKYSGYLEHCDEPFCTNCYNKSLRLMKLGKDITLLGLEIGLLTMKKGEVARFVFTPDYAYGQQGCPPLIPPNATVMFEVEVLDFLDSDESDAFFELTAAFLILGRSPSSEAEQCQIDTSKLLVLLNLSLTYLKLERPAQALAYGEKALEIDQKNAKALFRCGQACLCMTEYEKARDFLVRAQHIQPFNHDINNELKKLASCYRDYMEKEKEMCCRMFAPLNSSSG
ncbi:inactive peptidyl-prolyl cis-trans isomerase FKBP6 isoform X2 [Larus michahellis]|uniref:inactive peptidyl-prolyl cis-trans isomerase FKBP6 isoform X2 n=1 Tax=Larus michahellis TaxID=119627 RepID=UPI003D9B5B0B